MSNEYISTERIYHEYGFTVRVNVLSAQSGGAPVRIDVDIERDHTPDKPDAAAPAEETTTVLSSLHLLLLTIGAFALTWGGFGTGHYLSHADWLTDAPHPVVLSLFWIVFLMMVGGLVCFGFAIWAIIKGDKLVKITTPAAVSVAEEKSV
jgi:hypothetical protein